MDKLAPILTKTAVSGVLGYVGAQMLFGDMSNVAVPTLVGNLSPAVATGLAVGGSQLVAESISVFLLDSKTNEAWQETLSGFLNPALAAGASLAVPMLLMPGQIGGMKEMMMLAGYAGGSAMISDYSYEHFLKSYIE